MWGVGVALTEVLKIVAEDRASGTIQSVASKVGLLNREFASGMRNHDRIVKALTNTLVDYAKTAALSLAAFGAAGVAALGAFGAGAVRAAYDAEKLKSTLTGVKAPIVESVESMTTAFDQLHVAIGNSLIQALGLNKAAKIAAVIARESSPGGSGIGGVTTAEDAKKLAARARVQASIDSQKVGILDHLSAAVVELAEADERRYRIEAAQYSPGLAGKVLQIERDTIKERRARAEAQRLAADAEQSASKSGIEAFKKALAEKKAAEDKAAEDKAARDSEAREKGMDAAIRGLNPMDDTAIANRARDLLSERDAMIAAEKDRQASQLESLGKEQEQERMQIAQKNKQTADEALRRTEDQKRAADELASTYRTVGAEIGGMFNAIIQGGLSAEQVMLRLVGTVLSLAGNFLLPGAGAAASGIFGFLGSIFGFQDGGTVYHAASGMRVPGVGAGDRVPAMLEAGETVVPKNGSHPSFIEEVAAAAGGGGGNINVHLSQSYLVPPDSVTAQRTYQRGLVPVLQDLHSTGRGSVTNPRFRGTARGGKRG